MDLNELSSIRPSLLKLAQLRDLVSDLVMLISEQQGNLEKLMTENSLLHAENQNLRVELSRRKGPPPFVKPNSPLQQKKEKEKEKANAQEKKVRKKRTQSFVRKREPATRFVPHALDHCPDCGEALSGGHVHRSRQVIDIPIVPVEVIEHQIIARGCPCCGKRCLPSVDLSKYVLGKQRFGVGIMSLIGYLRNVCRLPVAQIQALLVVQHRLKISRGQIVELSHTLARCGQARRQAILEEIRQSPCVNGDETGWRENGANGYLWGFFTPTASYFHRDPSRAGAVALEILGDKFRNTLVTDFYAAYNALYCRHQRCWPHLLRDLHKLKEAHPDNKELPVWVASIKELYDEAIDYQKRCQAAIQNNAAAFGYNVMQRRDIRRQFESRLGLIAAPYLDQKAKKADPRAVLSERMEKFASELFVFIEYPEVPADNNAAERGLRPAVISRKISGGTRSEKGSITFETLSTLFATWKLRGEDAIANCIKIIQDANLPQPST